LAPDWHRTFSLWATIRQTVVALFELSLQSAGMLRAESNVGRERLVNTSGQQIDPARRYDRIAHVARTTALPFAKCLHGRHSNPPPRISSIAAAARSSGTPAQVPI
jgi:hypothetical protein